MAALYQTADGAGCAWLSLALEKTFLKAAEFMPARDSGGDKSACCGAGANTAVSLAGSTVAGARRRCRLLSAGKTGGVEELSDRNTAYQRGRGLRSGKRPLKSPPHPASSGRRAFQILQAIQWNSCIPAGQSKGSDGYK